MAGRARQRDVIKAIDNLIESPFSQGVANQLGTLAKFISDNWESLYVDGVLGQRFADQLANRAWLPAISKRPNGTPEAIFQLPAASLFEPSAIARKRDHDLVCSVLPVCMFPIEEAVAKAIGHSQPSEETVLAHFDNVIESMEDKKSANKFEARILEKIYQFIGCLLYTSPSPRDQRGSRMPSSA